jgi:hypothetical protein
MLDWSPEDIHRNAVVNELRRALIEFQRLDTENKDLTAITKARRQVEDLTSILEAYDKPVCRICGAHATVHLCGKHWGAA